MIRHRNRAAGAALGALALTSVVPTLAADSPFVGTWVGTWDNGQINEFRVVSIDDDGRATALYCAARGDGGFYFDITPTTIRTTLKRSGKRLEFRRPQAKMRYRFTLTGDNTLDFRYTRAGKSSTLKMARAEPSGCSARITAPNAPEPRAAHPRGLTVDRFEAGVAAMEPGACAATPGTRPARDRTDVLSRNGDNRNGRITCNEARRRATAPVHRSHLTCRNTRDGEGDGARCE